MQKTSYQTVDAILTNTLFNLKIFLLGGSLLLLYSCQSQSPKKNIRDYYYPVANFMDGKVYEYQAVNDSLAPFYWYFRTTISRGDTILTSEYFDLSLIHI